MKVLAGLCLLCAACGGATLPVDRAGGGDFTEVQAAIDAAAEGDTVLVRAGEYEFAEPLTFRGKAIAVRGEEGAAATTLRMAAAAADPSAASVVAFGDGEGADSILEGFTVTGGSGTLRGDPGERVGGGILLVGPASPTIRECTVTRNAAEKGGGVFCEFGSPRLIRVAIADNWADAEGGKPLLERIARVTWGSFSIAR